ncbi:contact-dependent growth inhibition system immunity protein [Paractinoplanes durhamensis]|uniref:contact-dependent growth inhibition system immunity protein n=1 Tax=Paractinoplanes durhamensis TaxID=113563 RepID=UPI001EF17AD7|nr:contact-dependent growth inhibition system immunity protein [Actinoplanes durhamensis]
MDRSLEEIEGDVWGEPPAGATRLVATVHELRRRPVGQLAVEDLRTLVGQQVGLDVVVPMVLDLLAAEPLAEGDFYPGDLLAATMRVPVEYWRAYPSWAARLRDIVDAVDVDDEYLRREISAFRGRGY